MTSPRRINFTGVSAGLVLVFGVLLASAMPARAADPLVSAAWLKQHLNDPNVVVLDVRSVIDGGGTEAYLKGHIPGAIHTDYDKAGWRVTRQDVPLMLPTVPELEKLAGETGIVETNHVVVVPAGVSATDFGSAARVYWTLKYLGMKELSILDGGYAAWTADSSNPVETGMKTPSPQIFTAQVDKAILAQAPDVERAITDKDVTLVDSRSTSYYTGKEKAPTAAAYGHIPGAVDVDNASLYDTATNRLKPKAELAKLVNKVAPDQPAVTYCNTGHWAAIDWFVLSEVLGRKNTRLYAGSMAEWSHDPKRPIASSRTKLDDLKKALGLGQ